MYYTLCEVISMSFNPVLDGPLVLHDKKINRNNQSIKSSNRLLHASYVGSIYVLYAYGGRENKHVNNHYLDYASKYTSSIICFLVILSNVTIITALNECSLF